MTIEKSASTGVHKTPGGGHANPTKGRASSSTLPGDASAGFASMLSALETVPTDPAEVATGIDPATGAGPLDGLGAADALAMTPDVLALAAQMAPASSTQADTVATVSLAARQGVRLGASALSMSGGDAALGPLAEAAGRGHAKVAGDGLAPAENLADATAPANKPHSSTDRTQNLGLGVQGLAGAVQAKPSDGADPAMLASLEALVKNMAASNDAREGGGEGRAVPTEGVGGVHGAAGSGGHSGVGLHSPGPDGGVTYGAGGLAEGTALTPDAPVTEQMNYWVSREVQNAQLKLDGFGADGVEVNITLQGKEAQVDFITDLPEARAALEGSSAQLKDMLSREGLVLSGVSVGTSAQGQAQPGGQQRKDAQAARQARVTASSAVTDRPALQPLIAPLRAGASALDLFV